jgi:hypothetical protein
MADRTRVSGDEIHGNALSDAASPYRHLRPDTGSDLEARLRRGLLPDGQRVLPRVLVRWLESSRLAERFARTVMAYRTRAEHDRVTRATIAQLGSDAPPAEYSAADEEEDFADVLKYAREIRAGKELVASESGALYAHLADVVGRELAGGTLRRVLNVGVGFAHIDSILAARHPDVRFVGIDRSMLTQVYNTAHFGDRPNMMFCTGSAPELLADGSWENAVLLTSRTLTKAPPSYVRSLYAAAAHAGVATIITVEPVGVSRQTGTWYRFSDDDQPGVVYRKGMYIHNYPGLLRLAGFRVVRSELIATNHPHADFRLVSLTACRSAA